ncbi:MAG: RNA methyltransferase, partial [Cyanobacteria bacterium J06639_1]
WGSRKHALEIAISGSDGELDTVRQARANAKACDLEEHVQFVCKPLTEVEAPTDCGVLMCNPPYGKRLGSDRELGDFYKLLGDILKQRFKGWTAYVLSGNKALAKSIGLKSSQRTPFYNGNLPCQLMKYELY